MPQGDTGHALDEASHITGWNTQNGRYPVGSSLYHHNIVLVKRGGTPRTGGTRSAGR